MLDGNDRLVPAAAVRAKAKADQLNHDRNKVLRLELDYGKDQVELLTDQQHLLLQLLGLLRRLCNRHKQQPLREELEDYAEYLGIDLKVDPNLLWIAEEAYFAPLPDNFEVRLLCRACAGQKTKHRMIAAPI